MKTLYKLYHSVFACLMLTMSVGMIYAFSLFIPEMTSHFGVSRNCMQFAFSLSIFFLGTGAALFGPFVEKDVKTAAALSTLLFVSGLLLTQVSILTGCVWLTYAGIGVCCGLGEGIGYLCPVKNMVMWFSKSRFKGLVMAVSIVSFGLGATLCSFLYRFLYPVFGLQWIFAVLAGVYFIMMTCGTIALRKPKYAKFAAKASPVSVDYWALVRDPQFVKHWLFMFFNISMGLILIGNRKNILLEAGVSGDLLITVFAICGFTNAFGRLLFPFIGDFMKAKTWIIPVILVSEFLFMSPAIALCSVIPLSIILVEGGYGGMFATAPQVLLYQYGNKPLSIVHGALLLAWGIASLFAFGCTSVMSMFCNGYSYIPWLLSAVYAIMFVYSLTLKKSTSRVF